VAHWEGGDYNSRSLRLPRRYSADEEAQRSAGVPHGQGKTAPSFWRLPCASRSFVYSVLAILLFLAALATILNSGKMLWEGLHHWTIAAQTLQVLDQLLIVLMLVEILHTVRISIRSHTLITEPFLVVGLIASIRRMLVITLEASTLTKEGSWSVERASIFRASMIELALLGLLVLILVFSITLLRRNALQAKEEEI